jgi:hypothetical protein
MSPACSLLLSILRIQCRFLSTARRVFDSPIKSGSRLGVGPRLGRHPHEPLTRWSTTTVSWHNLCRQQTLSTMAPLDGKAEAAPDPEANLSAILSIAEQVELTLLIANITDLMRKHLTDTFDASITSAKDSQLALHITDKNPNIHDSKPHEETEDEEKARKLRERREKELSAPKMLELKNAYLDFFNNWRESVISRVGAVVNSPKEVVAEQKVNAAIATTTSSSGPPEPKVIREF